MRNQLFLFLSFFIFLKAQSQNLVPNPSFENVIPSNFPCEYIHTKLQFENCMQNWMMPTRGTPDIYSTLINNACFTNLSSNNLDIQAARTGNNVCAFVAYMTQTTFNASYREYLQVKLLSQLIIGKKYYVELYVYPKKRVMYDCNNIGIHFSDNQISNDPNAWEGGEMRYTPQIKSNTIIVDTGNWIKISGLFIATSNAQYLTIGNFNNDSTTSARIKNPLSIEKQAYYYIDDILVEQICEPTDISLSICKGDPVILSSAECNPTSWALASSPDVALVNTPTLTISPQINTSYIATYAFEETSTFDVFVDSLPTFSFGKDTAICTGQTIHLDATTEHTTYLWQDRTTLPTYNVTKTGLYSVIAKNGCGIFTDDIFINVDTPPTFNFGADTTICKDEVLYFDASTSGASYLWQDGSTHKSYTVRNPGYYDVTIKNTCGTFHENTTLDLCCAGADIPNLITPNGDGMNDLFNIDCYGHGDFELSIHNKWGALIYESNAYLNNWGNKDIPDGIYYFVITYKGKFIYNAWVQVLK